MGPKPPLFFGIPKSLLQLSQNLNQTENRLSRFDPLKGFLFLYFVFVDRLGEDLPKGKFG